MNLNSNESIYEPVKGQNYQDHNNIKPLVKTVKWDQNESPSKESYLPISNQKDSVLDQEYEKIYKIEFDNEKKSNCSKQRKKEKSINKQEINESNQAIKRMEELLKFDSPSKVKPSERLQKLKPKSLNRKEFLKLINNRTEENSTQNESSALKLNLEKI